MVARHREDASHHRQSQRSVHSPDLNRELLGRGKKSSLENLVPNQTAKKASAER